VLDVSAPTEPWYYNIDGTEITIISNDESLDESALSSNNEVGHLDAAYSEANATLRNSDEPRFVAFDSSFTGQPHLTFDPNVNNLDADLLDTKQECKLITLTVCFSIFIAKLVSKKCIGWK
jgi:hypothetical protein